MLNRLASRTAFVIRQSRLLFGSQVRNPSMQKRFAGAVHAAYREVNYDPNRKIFYHMSNMMAGVMWWWIMWNLWTDWRHLIGHYIWPETSDWSDEHLGIPPDDYD